MSVSESIGILVSGVSLMTTVVGGAMAWQKIKDRSSENAKRICETDERIDKLSERIDVHDGLVTKLAVLSERLEWIQKELSRRNGRGTGNHQHDD